MSEMDQWFTMVRHFCDKKLDKDEDWAILSKLLKILHVGQVKNIDAERIFNIIEFIKKRSDESHG